MSTELEFRPKIVGIICNWCCYGGADLCGVSRFQYPPYIRLIRVMCSGRVDFTHIFRAFSNGMDGVFVGGCHLNDCHYVTKGNYDAISMVTLCRRILGHIGVDPERLRLEWVSAGEGIRFANIMNEYGARVRKLGPLGRGEGLDEKALRFRLEAVTRLIPYLKLLLTERFRLPVRSEEGFRQVFEGPGFERLFEETVLEKLAASELLMLLRTGPLSTAELAGKLRLSPSEVARHVRNTSKQGLVRFDAGAGRYSLA